MSELKRDQLLMAVVSGRGPAYLRGVDLSDLNLSGANWLIEADLRHANLSNAILSKANLKNANLERANLYACDLSGANLEGANLKDAKITMANLKLAILRNADLQRARLVGANLVKADLEDANLEGADLEGAELQGANLWNARLEATNLKMANLRDAAIQATNLPLNIKEADRGADISTTPDGFSGVIDGVQLTDLIQLICLSRSNTLIRIESPRGRGTIHVRSGRVRHAEAGSLEGEKAFCQMLQWENGRLETSPLVGSSFSTIEKPLEHLIIESMRLRDEKESEESSDH